MIRTMLDQNIIMPRTHYQSVLLPKFLTSLEVSTQVKYQPTYYSNQNMVPFFLTTEKMVLYISIIK
jgi:hypothetical protein